MPEDFRVPRKGEVPTCLTLGSGARWSAAAKSFSRAPVIQGSLAKFLPPRDVQELACSRLASRRRPVRGVAQKRYGSRARSRSVLRAKRQRQRSDRNGGACAHEESAHRG